jgi:hypothetical protein
MIIRFSAENFRSIREKQELTLVASSLKDLPDSLIRLERLNYDLLPVAAIYGANASGKTNVFRALHFISFVVENSHRNWKPGQDIWRTPFALDASSSGPSSFEVEFILAGVRYRYGFTLDSQKINEEWLYAYPNGKQQQWFTRSETPEKKFSFSRNFPGEREKNRTIEGLTRPNSLYLSAAAQNNHEALLPLYNFFVNDIRFLPSGARCLDRRATEEMCLDDGYKSLILQYLKAADLGIAGLRAEQEEFVEAATKFMSALRENLPAKLQVDLPNKHTKILLQHRGQGGSQLELEVENESDGTMAYFSLLGPIMKTLERGSVLCIDDLDSSLHPLLALELVRMFNDRKRNPRGAQMIFNTHDTNLLDNSLLRRDQIWFTEKDSSGATHLYPLSDFKPRQNENLERGYLQGRYGAVPFLESGLVSQDKDD